MKYFVGLLTVAIIALGAFVYFRPAVVEQLAGSVPVINSPLQINGVSEYFFAQSFRIASSTACDFKTPNATTSIGKATVLISSSPNYAQTYELGYSATQDATTSALVASYTVGALAPAAFAATTTATAPVDSLLPPNTHIVLNLSTSTATGKNQAVGYCQLTMLTLNGN